VKAYLAYALKNSESMSLFLSTEKLYFTSMTKHSSKRKVEESEHESSDDTENKEIQTSEPTKKKSRICNVQPDGVKHMVWVKNIDPKTPIQLLLKELSKFGEIQGSYFSETSEKQLLQAHINFKSEAAAYASLELNNTVFDGATIEVKLGKDGAKRSKVVNKERRQSEKKAQKIQKNKKEQTTNSKMHHAEELSIVYSCHISATTDPYVFTSSDFSRSFFSNEYAIIQFPFHFEHHRNQIRYFEMKIKDISSLKGVLEIAIGMAAPNYNHGMTGWSENSIGYHADDGQIYDSYSPDNSFNFYSYKGELFGVNDTVGLMYNRQTGRVTFTKNGKLIHPEITTHEILGLCDGNELQKSENKPNEYMERLKGFTKEAHFVPTVTTVSGVTFCMNFGDDQINRPFAWNGYMMFGTIGDMIHNMQSNNFVDVEIVCDGRSY
jgi:hypothetical protein